MNVDFYDSKRRKKLLEQLHAQFGMKEVPKALFETGKEKIRAYSGDLSIDELYALSKLTNVEFLGLYVFRQEERFVRVSFDAGSLFAEQFSHHVVELTEEQMERWMHGNNIVMALDKGLYIVKYGRDVLGCGVSDGQALINFVPKDRRIRRS